MHYFKKNIFILLFFPGIFLSQNLVPNGDFEEYTFEKSFSDKIFRSKNWKTYLPGYPYISMPSWVIHTEDVYKGHSDQIAAFSGNGQGAVLTFMRDAKNYRSYLTTKLKLPLVKGEKYKVSFYLSGGKGITYSYTTNNFGVFFFKDTFNRKSTRFCFAPQYEIKDQIIIFNEWKNYSFIYIAEDSMQYVSFGNFRNDSSTIVSSSGKFAAQYYIDKVEIFPEKDPVVITKEVPDIIDRKYDDTKIKPKDLPVKEVPKQD